MQRLKENKEIQHLENELKELEINELSFHFNVEELIHLPQKMKIQAVLSMFDLIYLKCGKALEKLFPYLFSIGNKRYDIYIKVLANYENLEGSNECLSKMLKWLRPYLEENLIVNKNKIERAIKLIEEGRIKSLDSLYSVLPRNTFYKISKFDNLRKDLKFKNNEEAWRWFLERELDLIKLEE